MPKGITDVAERFVDLVLRHDRWNQTIELTAEDLQVLFETVSAAGFEVNTVVPGQIKGYYTDIDGSKTGETYWLNKHCLFKAVDEGGNELVRATGWLDCAVRFAAGGSGVRERHEIIGKVAVEIRKSIPLTPVQLTPEGDFLMEYPPAPGGSLSIYPYFLDHYRDDSSLTTCVGVHKYCNGWMDRYRATATHDAIVCRKCHLRVLFPREVKTYGELRQALSFPVAEPA